jgi:hypothetical protein
VNGNPTIGALALYLLFVWLISAASAAWLTERKGYGERAGLMLGLLLTAAGLLVALLLPPRSGSKWRAEGWLPRRRRRAGLRAALPTTGARPGGAGSRQH